MTLLEQYEALCDQPSDINEHLPILHAATLDTDAQIVVELGVRTGLSTRAFLAALEITGGCLYSVDIDPCPEIDPTPVDWWFIHGDDRLSTHVIPNGIDVLLIDSSHEYNHTLDELRLYAPKCRAGAKIFLHDTEVEAFPHHVTVQPPYPVRKAVHEWALEAAQHVDWHPNNNGLAEILYRPEEI